MRDQYGRNINYIRISVTDRCNLRCTYCMPQKGVEQVPHSHILTYDEIVRLCTVFAAKGISRVKITGGEPLVRKGLDSLIKEILQIKGMEEVTLTSNGILLKEQLASLVNAGLDAVNISLDTLDGSMYRAITRSDKLSEVLCGVKEALSYPRLKVKINCVPLSGVNESQWALLAGLARDNPLDVRFIEVMPIGLGKNFHGNSQEEILTCLRKVYGRERFLSGSTKESGNGPSVYAQFKGFRGKIGFISAISHKFCSRCNRIRLTAEGFLKPCLHDAAGVDLRKSLRSGVPDEEIGRLVETVIYEKPQSHHFDREDERGFEQRQMSGIGG